MKSIFLLLFVLLFNISMQAQHCPYDGTYMVTIKVVDKHDKMLTDINTVFYLLEVDNPMADSCSYAAGLIKKQFLNSREFIADCDQKFNRSGLTSELNNRLKNCGVFANANMMLNLNQAQNTCMLNDKSAATYANYTYRKRKFVIAYSINGKEFQQPLPPDFIYALCTNNKDLKNFKTITIKL